MSLLAGLLLFLGVHSVSIVAPAWRDRMAASLGGAQLPMTVAQADFSLRG